jgi:hypothetical protein
MPLGQLRSFIVLCLGRQEPEGGVVLGLHLDYNIFHVFYILSPNIILLCICYIYVCIRYLV